MRISFDFGLERSLKLGGLHVSEGLPYETGGNAHQNSRLVVYYQRKGTAINFAVLLGVGARVHFLIRVGTFERLKLSVRR